MIHTFLRYGSDTILVPTLLVPNRGTSLSESAVTIRVCDCLQS